MTPAKNAHCKDHATRLKNKASKDHDEHHHKEVIETTVLRPKEKPALEEVKDYGVASPRKRRRATEASAVAGLHWPRCGFRLGALQAVVTPTSQGRRWWTRWRPRMLDSKKGQVLRSQGTYSDSLLLTCFAQE
jgi:hypothetical protein